MELKTEYFVIFMLLLVAILPSLGQQPFKLATASCLAKHDQISNHIEFRANCKKVIPYMADVDDADPINHSCFVNRWYCSKMCTNNGKCSVSFVITFNLHFDPVTAKPIDVDCACGYDKCQEGCTKPTYLTDLETIDQKFKTECSASCEQNLAVDGANVVYDSDGGLGSTATVTCTELSSTLIGDSLLTCVADEKWDNDPPYCKPGCPILTFDSGVFIVTYTQQFDNSVKYQGTASIGCVEPSTALTGSGMLTCGDNQEWDNDFPDCKLVCQEFVEPDNAQECEYTGQRSDKLISEGGTFMCICVDGYLTAGGTVTIRSTCTAGTWSQIAKCITKEERCKKALPAYASTIYQKWDTCIVYIDDVPHKWDDAKTWCSQLNEGSLLYYPIERALETNEFDIYGVVFLGLRQKGEGLPLADGWQWHKANGIIEDENGIINWAANEPDGPNADNRCGAIHYTYQKLIDFPCLIPVPFLCQFQP